MKIYFDTSVLIALLFGELSEVDQDRQPLIKKWFQVANDATNLISFVSLYTLQELVVFVYENYPPPEAPTVLRLALLILFQNKLILLPLLDRVNTLRYRRRVSQIDRSDLPHLILALKHDCDYLVTYDEHFSSATEVTAITPEDLLPLLNVES